MHVAAAAQAERAALLVQLGDGTRRDIASRALRDILGFYAENYARYPSPEPSQGRVMPHVLNESVWTVTLLRSLRWSGGEEALPADVRIKIRAMARSLIEVLRLSVTAIHNIPCWILAALAECGALLQDKDLLLWCRDHPLGIEQQIARGFRSDGLWYEVSPTYHCYALAALLSYAEAAGPQTLSPEARHRLALALQVPPLLAYEDGTLPAYADGWPEAPLAGVLCHAEAAQALLPDESIDCSSYLRKPLPCPLQLYTAATPPPVSSALLSTRFTVTALVFGPDEVEEASSSGRSSVLLPHSGVAILRNKHTRLGLRFGPDGGPHDHRDKLCVDVETSSGWRSLDLGTSGYGSAFTKWMKSPVSHNLIVLDGAPQPPHAGHLMEFSDHHVRAEACFDQSRLCRALTLEENGGWRDESSVLAGASRKIDWIFHGDGRFFPDDDESGQPAAFEETEGGYEWLSSIRQWPYRKIFRGSWRTGQTTMKLILQVPEGFQIHTAEAGGNPGGQPLGIVMLRGEGRRAEFCAEFLPVDAD